MIEPTPGRVVWYWPGEFEPIVRPLPRDGVPRPLAAHIANVHTSRSVTLMVIDANGCPQPRALVQLRQNDDAIIGDGRLGYCEWMPFQKGQVAKTEALERKVNDAAGAHQKQ
jgi:hypothetical protein